MAGGHGDGRSHVVGTTTVVRPRGTPVVDPCMVAALGDACRANAVVDFDYRDRRGGTEERRVEPHHLVTHGGHWYLIAHDTERGDWRIFRLDRISGLRTTHGRFTPRELPAPDPATFLTRVFAGATHRYTVRIRVRLSAEDVRSRVYGSVPGGIEGAGPDSCLVRISAQSLDLACQYTAAVVSLGADFELDAPPEVTRRLRAVGAGLAGVPAEHDTARSGMP